MKNLTTIKCVLDCILVVNSRLHLFKDNITIEFEAQSVDGMVEPLFGRLGTEKCQIVYEWGCWVPKVLGIKEGVMIHVLVHILEWGGFDIERVAKGRCLILRVESLAKAQEVRNVLVY